MKFISKYLYIWSFPHDKEEAYSQFVLPSNLISLRLVSFINVFGMALFLVVDFFSNLKFNHTVVFAARAISLLISLIVFSLSLRKPVSVSFIRIGIVLLTLVALSTALTTATYAGLPPYYLTNLLFVLFVLVMAASGLNFKYGIQLNTACFLMFIMYSQLVNRNPFYFSQYLHLSTTFLYVAIAGLVLESRRRLSFLQFSDLKDQKIIVEDLSQQKDRIISILSHDVASPLNSLSGLLALQANGHVNDEELRPLLKEMGVRLNNVSSLLRSLLRWSKSQMKGFVPEKTEVLLSEHLKDHVELFRPASFDKGIEISLKVSERLVIFADEEMIRIAIRNLVSNAIKFAMVNTTITIEAFLQGDEKVMIKVSNKGDQIPFGLRQRLFSFEVPSTVGTVGEKGTGIGLAMSSFFVKLNEGDLSLEHYTGPNDKTTCFSILLPAVTYRTVEAVPANGMEETMYA